MAANLIKLSEFRNLTGTKLAHCHGVFDVLHVGHLQYLKSARKFAQRLVVTLTSDRYVSKGPGRPYFNEKQRAEMLASLDCVDCVAIVDHPTAIPAIEIIKPAFYVKGPDYKDMNGDVTGMIHAEKAAVEAHGGKLVFTEAETHSSSALVNRFFAPWSDEQRRVITEVKEYGGMRSIKQTLRDIENSIEATVVGELIWDTYRFVQPEGLSSKSPSISARFEREERYQGGAWAITKHMHSFCPTVLITSGVEHEKIRYISSATGQRLFEVTDIKAEGNLPSGLPPHNLRVEADFGHGLLFGLSDTKEFKALNVQTNSSNYGFNVFRKHSKFDYLVLDTREIRLAYNDRVSDATTLGMRAHEECQVPIGLTLGPNGSAFYSDGKMYLCPAFTDQVVDATGAGDAFLALTSLLVRIGAAPQLIGFLGNVFAGLKTKIIGNKESVTKAQLLKACQAILS